MLNQEEVNLSLGLILFHSNLWVSTLPIKMALLGCLMILGSLRSQVNPGLQRTPTRLFSQIPQGNLGYQVNPLFLAIPEVPMSRNLPLVLSPSPLLAYLPR
jgi:hypothetical protein